MSTRNKTRTTAAAVALLIATATLRNGTAAPLPQNDPPRDQTAVPSAPLAQAANEAQAWAGKIAPALIARAASTAGNVDFLIAFNHPEGVGPRTIFPGAPARLRWIAETGDGIEREFTPAGVRILQRYSHLATLYASAPASALALLAADPRVKAIAVNHKVHKLDADGRALMHVSAIQPPYNGAGVGIAIFDTGVDWTHPELTPLGTKTIALFDAFHTVGDASYAKDDEGHGTEVAGVAAAAGVSPSAIGVAPAATVVSVKILDNKGSGTDSQILNGINAVLTSITSGNPYNIRVANFSLGGYDSSASGSAAVPPQPCDDPLSWPLVDAFQNLVNANVVPVVSAGNGGCTNGVAWPACISTSLAVGAVYDTSVTGGIQYTDAQQCNGKNGCSDSVTGVGQVACFSDSGAKLDVWAPTCTNAPVMGGGYESTLFCGTSASAPFAAGMVALLSQAVPTASAATIRDALKNSGMPITDARNSITRNLILADQAIAQVQCVPLAVPAGLASTKASACSGDQFVVSWGAVSGAASYTVQMATEPTFASPTSTTTSTTNANFSSTQASSGTLYLRVRANSSCATSSDWSSPIQVTYTPQCQTTYAHTYFVSGVARTPGFAPAYWYSDLTVLNAAAAAAQIRVSFYGSSFRTAAPVALGGHQQITWTDALNTLFGISQDKGMMVVESTQPLRAYSRTYSQVASGMTVETFGQAYVGKEASEALTSTGVGYLGGLRSDGQYRTNLEFANVSQTATDVNVLFYNGAGTQVGTLLVTVPGLRWVQKTLALPSGQSSAFAEVHVLAVGAQVISFATVVDGTSTDPTGIELWIP